MTRTGHRLRGTIGGLLALALLGPLAGCAEQPAAGPEGLHDTLEQWRQRSGAHAVVLSVDGPQVSWTGASGTSGRSEAVTARDPFRVASLSKLFVATVVLQLVAEQRLGLDDQLADYLPEYPDADLITLRQLLNHTSGVPDYTQIEGWGQGLLKERDRIWTPSEVLSVAAGRDPEFEPGTDYAYSNTGYVLLGEVVRVATGTPWVEQVRRRVLDPLDLRDTYVAGAEPGQPVVPGYFDVDNDGTQENVETGRGWPAQDTSEGAAGAVVSTAADLVTFGDALFRGGLLGDSELAAMTEEGPHHPRNSNYGLGLEIQRRDYRTTTWGHGGFLPGFRSTLRYLPDADLLVVALVNDSRADADDLAELAYRSVAELDR